MFRANFMHLPFSSPTTRVSEQVKFAFLIIYFEAEVPQLRSIKVS